MAANSMEGAQDRFKILNSLIKQYDCLIQSYMLDYFTSGLYEKLPQSWKKALQSIQIEDMGCLLDLRTESVKGTILWPLSLLCLKKVLSEYMLNRSCYLNTKLLSEEPKTIEVVRHTRLKNIFLKHVKRKKRYEISRMAEETVILANKAKVKWIIDIGSGIGHLCRTIAYGYGFNVCGIESQEQLTKRAEELNVQLEITASKHLTIEEMRILRSLRPIHATSTVKIDITMDNFTKMIKDLTKAEECPDFGIVGLHPCGDLAVTLLRIFVGCRQAKFINIVGCCYHKMNFSDKANQSYPLSNFCTQLNSNLTPAAGALGCHAIETYSSRLINGDYDHLKIHCFRASLERIIVRLWPNYARWGLNSVRHYPDLSFEEYCEKALLKLPLKVPREIIYSKETMSDLKSWKAVVYYHSLWLLFGPAIESVVLLDRLIFLLEKGIPAELKAIFDPELSPRNQILSAIKEF